MLQRKSVVNKIEHCRTGEILVQFSIVIEEDGKELAHEYHRVCLPQAANEQEQMQHIQDHFPTIGYPPLSEADVTWVIESCVFNRTIRPM